MKFQKIFLCFCVFSFVVPAKAISKQSQHFLAIEKTEKSAPVIIKIKEKIETEKRLIEEESDGVDPLHSKRKTKLSDDIIIKGKKEADSSECKPIETLAKKKQVKTPEPPVTHPMYQFLQSCQPYLEPFKKRNLLEWENFRKTLKTVLTQKDKSWRAEFLAPIYSTLDKLLKYINSPSFSGTVSGDQLFLFSHLYHQIKNPVISSDQTMTDLKKHIPFLIKHALFQLEIIEGAFPYYTPVISLEHTYDEKKLRKEILELENFLSSPTSFRSILLNQKGYESFVDEEKIIREFKGKYEKGPELMSSKGDRIGYTIFYPEKTIRAFIVHVYGGSTTQAPLKSRSFFSPTTVTVLDDVLSKKGIGIVRLNLIDLLENTKHQDEMEAPFFQRILESISFFIQTIKNPKSSLYQKVSEKVPSFTTLPFILAGHSFGGLVTVWCACQNMGYDGYIASSPYLTSVGDLQTVSKTKTHLLASHLVPQAQKISAPTLLIYNANDMKTTIASAFSFLESCTTDVIRKYLSLFICPMGTDSPNGRGHDPTEIPYFLKQQLDIMIPFITKKTPPTGLTTFLEQKDRFDIFKMREMKWSLLTASLSPVATFDEILISKAFSHYYYSSEILNKAADEDFFTHDGKINKKAWQTQFLPLWYELFFHNEINGSPVKVEYFRIQQHFSFKEHVFNAILSTFKTDWEKNAFPFVWKRAIKSKGADLIDLTPFCKKSLETLFYKWVKNVFLPSMNKTYDPYLNFLYKSETEHCFIQGISLYIATLLDAPYNQSTEMNDYKKHLEDTFLEYKRVTLKVMFNKLLLSCSYPEKLKVLYQK